MSEQPADPAAPVVQLMLPVSLEYARALWNRLGRAIAAAERGEETVINA